MSISKEAVEAAARGAYEAYTQCDGDWAICPEYNKAHWRKIGAGSLTAALPFLARPAPSQSDEERAHQFMGYNFGDDELGSAEHAELVRTLTLFSAAVRAEETLTKMAEGYCEGGWGGARYTIFKCIDAIRTRKP